MSDLRLAVSYYTVHGTNQQVAREAVRAAQAAGAEVRLRRSAETAPDEVVRQDEKWWKIREGKKDIPEAKLAAVHHQTRRLVEVAGKLAG